MSGNSLIDRLQIKLLTTVTWARYSRCPSGVVGMLGATAHFSPSSDLSLTIPVQLHQNQSSHRHDVAGSTGLPGVPFPACPARLFARRSQGAVRIIPPVEGTELPVQTELSLTAKPCASLHSQWGFLGPPKTPKLETTA